MLPNFIIGGTSAGGTSFLSAAMIQHPDIYLPKKMRPEPHYFYKSWEYEKPLSYYEETYFKGVTQETAIGERSSSYLFGGLRDAKRIHEVLPEIKLIFTLRNPIERAYANYRYTALQGLEDVSFDYALEHEQERIDSQEGIWKEIQPYNYTGRSFYGQQMEEYLEVFKREQILFIKSEDMNKNPYENFKKVFQFLNVDDSFRPMLPPNFTSLSVKDAKMQKFHREYFGDRFDLLVESIRKEEDPQEFSNNEKDDQEIANMKDNLVDSKLPMSEKSRKYLQDLFYDDMKLVQKYVEFSIDDWK